MRADKKYHNRNRWEIGGCSHSRQDPKTKKRCTRLLFIDRLLVILSFSKLEIWAQGRYGNPMHKAPPMPGQRRANVTALFLWEKRLVSLIDKTPNKYLVAAF